MGRREYHLNNAPLPRTELDQRGLGQDPGGEGISRTRSKGLSSGICQLQGLFASYKRCLIRFYHMLMEQIKVFISAEKH